MTYSLDFRQQVLKIRGKEDLSIGVASGSIFIKDSPHNFSLSTVLIRLK